ncbi:unnamed protein product, partial [Phaeothamnion confervicola]
MAEHPGNLETEDSKGKGRRKNAGKGAPDDAEAIAARIAAFEAPPGCTVVAPPNDGKGRRSPIWHNGVKCIQEGIHGTTRETWFCLVSAECTAAGVKIAIAPNAASNALKHLRTQHNIVSHLSKVGKQLTIASRTVSTGGIGDAAALAATPTPGKPCSSLRLPLPAT